MSFDNPRILGFLLVFIILIPAVLIRYRKSRERAALFASASPSHERGSLLRELRLRMIMSDVFFLLFTGLLIIALAGPRWGVRIVADYRRGVDVILAFDLSRSMDVRDCFPPQESGSAAKQEGISRLERALDIAGDLSVSLGDVRFGAAIGKGKGVLAVPLTYDTETVISFLYSLDSMAITGRGTNLESLIGAASGAFQDSVPSRRGIILFTDGEALSGSFQAAAEKARKDGIALSIVGLGSDGGGKVPVEKSVDAPDGFLLAPDGTPVISARQTDVLRNGAERTGGVYISGSRADAARFLGTYTNALSAESRLTGHRREANPRWRIFVLAAMACLGGARLMGFSRRRQMRQGGKNLAALSVLLCAITFLFSSCENTQAKLLILEGNFFSSRGFYTEAISSYLKAMDYDEAAPYAEYGLGSAYFALEEGDAALERYRTAEQNLSERGEDAELKYRIHYNRGIIYFEKGAYVEAASAFREALEADGSRIEAKRNLELSLLTISRTSPPQAAPGGAESGREGPGGSSSVLFDYLRQKEQEQWKSREWSGESDSSGPDY